MPGEGLTHGPPATRKQAAVTTGSAAINRHSPRDGLTAYTWSPWRAGLLAAIARATLPHEHARDTSFGVSGHHDFTVRDSRARRAQRSRPPRPTSTYRDDAYVPLHEAG